MSLTIIIVAVISVSSNLPLLSLAMAECSGFISQLLLLVLLVLVLKHWKLVMLALDESNHDIVLPLKVTIFSASSILSGKYILSSTTLNSQTYHYESSRVL